MNIFFEFLQDHKKPRIPGAVSANVTLVALILESVWVAFVKNAATGVVPSGTSSASNACSRRPCVNAIPSAPPTKIDPRYYGT